jgi:uncharacterized protein
MIRSVSGAGIRIGNETYSTTIALSKEAVIGNWPEKPVRDLVEADFAQLLDAGADVIVIGTGAANIFPPRDLVFAMARRGIGLEVMDTKAAARTFNVLAGEGRPVAAVLYPDRD